MDEGEAKVHALVDEAKNAKDEKRAGIPKRNARRNEKPGAAWKLTKEALAA